MVMNIRRLISNIVLLIFLLRVLRGNPGLLDSLGCNIHIIYQILKSFLAYFRQEMVLDIFEKGIVGVGDLLLEVAVVSVPVFFLQLLHPSKTARLDLCQRFQSPSWPSLRHSAMNTAVTWVLDELERNQKKGKSSKNNFKDDGHLSSGPDLHV